MESASRRLNVNSEKETQDLLLRNIRALPERELLPPSTTTSLSTQLPLMSRTLYLTQESDKHLIRTRERLRNK
ncbi:hypothetical protein EDB82DRAFT_493410 [Fusarium venenatum]|uniref:uncharacterized protein n=1 Tax=Fusarium venenatum TaxID=56646 RepID=UPI001D9F4D62|nr:hypothetical protein EDB82DRAFT_493410 [Fusarium venenatum]